MSNTNGKVKLEIAEMNKPAKFKLLRECFTGKNNFGEYHLYPVKDESGNELSFFAPDDVHAVLAEAVKAGDEFILTRVENGKKGSSKLQVSIIGKSENADVPVDKLREIMRQSIQDAVEVTKAFPDVPFHTENLTSILLSLFIQRARSNG